MLPDNWVACVFAKVQLLSVLFALTVDAFNISSGLSLTLVVVLL
jgi:hypothetical protein